MSEKAFPPHARVVIVGGGVMGAGLAYHLAHEGWGEDTVLLEKAELTSGSTWHAAGQITHSTSSFGLGKCVDYNIGLYSGALEEETGQAVTWHGCGSYRLAYTEDEMDWLRHTLSVGRSLGFNIELVGTDHSAANHPFYNLDGVIGALHTPDDGHVDPTNVTMAMAAGARQKGVRIIRHCRATNITQADTGEWVVETEKGTITCEHVVNAGTSGAYVPIYFYLVPRGSSDYFGLRNADTRFKELAYMTGRVPYYEKDLVDFDPIDLQHYTRFLNAHLGLAWLATDSISKLELELSSACFRMTFHEFYNSAYGNVQGTGRRARIQENAVNPSQGVSFGRGEAWGLIATTAHYALAGRAERAVMFPYMQTVARTARSGQSACTGNTTAVLIHKEFKGAYRTRQSFEVGYFVNAAEAMRSTVFERTDGATNTLLNDLGVDAAYSTVREPFWSTTGNGQVRVIAVRPRDLELAEFCSNIPANGIGDVPYHDQFTGMPAWAYAFARTNDGLFMLRTNQATGSAGNALAQLEALGTDQLDRMAPMLALLQGP